MKNQVINKILVLMQAHGVSVADIEAAQTKEAANEDIEEAMIPAKTDTKVSVKAKSTKK